MPLFSLTRRPPTHVMPASCFRCHWTRHLGNLFYIFLQNNLVTRVSLCAKLFTADKGCLAGLRLLLVTSHKGRMQTFTECHWGVIENIFPIKDDTGHFFCNLPDHLHVFFEEMSIVLYSTVPTMSFRPSAYSQCLITGIFNLCFVFVLFSFVLE